MRAMKGTSRCTKPQYPFSHIKLGEMLGAGSTATVFKAQAFAESNKTDVLAVKLVSMTGPEDLECLERLRREFDIYVKLEESQRELRPRLRLGLPLCYGFYGSHSTGTYALILSYEGESFQCETWRECGLTDADK